MSIKDEIQGQTGYLKKVRDEYMPDTKKMAELAFELYSKDSLIELTPEYVSENADEVLKNCFRLKQVYFNARIMKSCTVYYYIIMRKYIEKMIKNIRKQVLECQN